MNNFEKSDYFKSNKHIKNTIDAGILGREKIQILKKQRIDDYYLNPILCKCCNKPLSYDNKRKIFCNSSCSASFNNKKRQHKDETKNKIKESINNYHNIKSKTIIKICECCGKEFEVLNISRKRRVKNCSEECSMKSRKVKSSIKMKDKVKNGTHKGWQSRNITSYPEKFFIGVLKNNNLLDKCKVNYKIKKKDLGLDEEGNYFLDFYFFNKKIDLEIDGKQHNFRKEHDTKRDEYVNKNGITVYRIKWKSINNEKGKRYIENEIKKFLNFYHNIEV